MSRQLLVSNTHFGHRAILSQRMQAPRPLASMEGHDETLVANWNAVVQHDDNVWHLGDFCYRCSEDYARSIFDRLRGRQRFLVRGNHDRIGARLSWDGIFDVARVVVPEPDGVHQSVWMSHYAHRVWPRFHRGVAARPTIPSQRQLSGCKRPFEWFRAQVRCWRTAEQWACELLTLS